MQSPADTGRRFVTVRRRRPTTGPAGRSHGSGHPAGPHGRIKDFAAFPAPQDGRAHRPRQLRIDRSLAPIRRRRRRRWVILGVVGIAAALAAWFVLAAARGRRADHAGRDHVPSQQFVRAQRHRLRRRAAQGGDLLEGDRAPGMAGRRRRLAREGGRGDRAPRRPRRRRAGGERARPTSTPRGPRSSRRRPRSATRCAQLQAQRRISWPRNSSPRPSLDTAKARADAPPPAWPARSATIAAAEANARNAAGRGRPHADPRAVRRRDPVQERERRRHRHAVLERRRLQGRGGDDGRHGARSRSRPTSPSRASPRSRSASRRRSCSTRCPTRAFAAASAAWCRPSTAPRRR